MVTDDLEVEDDVFDPVLARAQEIIASATSALAEPRPFAEAAAAYEALARERAELIIEKRAAPEGVVRKVRVEPPAPAADDDAKPVSMGVFVKVIQNLIGEERERAAREQQPLLERMARLEARLAQSEGRLAGVESKGKRK